jgi:hypothetical protein
VNVAPDVYLVAVGLESGCINFYKWSSVSTETGDNWQKCLELDNSYPLCNVVFYHPFYTHLMLSAVPLLYELSSMQAHLSVYILPKLLFFTFLPCVSFCMTQLQTYWPVLILVSYTHTFDKYSFTFHIYPVICTKFPCLFWKIEHG